MFGITDFIVAFCTQLIERTGVTGIIVLMGLESMVAPVPSEAVMPFAGFLWFAGKMTWVEILIASTLGSLLGSLISYYMGAYLSEAIVKRWGRYLLLNEHHLHLTHQFFARYGDKAVFFSRFIPVVRHFISLAAGAGRMNLVKFTIYTTVGAAGWNMFLAWVGYQLGSQWEKIGEYTKIVDVLIILGIIGSVAYWWLRRRKATHFSEPPTLA